MKTNRQQSSLLVLFLILLIQSLRRHKGTRGRANFLPKKKTKKKEPLQFSSTPVKRHRRSQRGDRQREKQTKKRNKAARENGPTRFLFTPPSLSTWCVCQHCSLARRNWHNCQVSARQRSRVSSWRAQRRRPRVIKGTLFWRRSRGRASTSGATARLIKWLPLISAMHMKGLCLLRDRFGASSPRDLPGYTSGGAAREEEKKKKRQQCIARTASS